MKAARWYGKHDVRVENIEEPMPGPGEVKVKVKWCGICGSDVHEYHDGPITIPVDTPHPITGKTAPIVVGHEYSGEVVAVGEGVSGFKPGDRVVAETTIACMECHACKAGEYTHCENLGITGLSGYGGAFAEYCVVKEMFLHHIPDGLDYAKAAIVEPFTVGFHAVDVGDFKAGMCAVVLGAGPIALGVVEVLKASGARQVICVARKEKPKAFAIAAGADIVLDPEKCDAAEEILRLTGGIGADICFETFGSDIGPEIGQKCLRSRGTLVIISLWSRPAQVDLMTTVQKELRIVGTNLSSFNDYESVVKMLCDGRMKADYYVTKRIYLDDLVEEGYGALLGPERKDHVKILVTPEKELLD